MSPEHYVEEASLSVAWARAVRFVASARGNHTGPLIVSVTGFDGNGVVRETPAIRSALEEVLEGESKQSVETVANTIFPYSMWNKAQPRSLLFRRYASVAPRLRHASTKNNRGLYFERMITGGPTSAPNQLEHTISMCELGRKRPSALQIATFDPRRDHSTSPRLGFPCLQHVTFAPCDDALIVNAFYASQYLVERGYGNYLGLCRLAEFIAHELRLPISRFTCLVGIAYRDFAKSKLEAILATLDRVESAARTTA